MNPGAAFNRLTWKGLTIVAMAALLVTAVGLGIAQGGSPALTKKQANKKFLTKKAANKFLTTQAADAKYLTRGAADGAYQPKETKLQVPAATGQPLGPNTYVDTNAQGSGAHHASSGFGPIGWSWILPPNYPAGSPLTVRVYYLIQAIGCNFNLEPNSLSINKIGSNSVGSQNDINNGPDFLPTSGGQVASVDWIIPGTVQGEQLTPGTSVLMGTFRNADTASDTCNADLVLKGHEVSW
jgi:hypothetical protein